MGSGALNIYKVGYVTIHPIGKRPYKLSHSQVNLEVDGRKEATAKIAVAVRDQVSSYSSSPTQ
jgi:hypothetical protein